MVGSGSRFAKVPVYKVKRADGVLITVFERRMPLQPTKTTNIAVLNTDRIDILAYDLYKDPSKYWAICDCNVEKSPFDLLTVRSNTIIAPSSTDVNSYGN
jgi:hypothetical protein